MVTAVVIVLLTFILIIVTVAVIVIVIVIVIIIIIIITDGVVYDLPPRTPLRGVLERPKVENRIFLNWSGIIIIPIFVVSPSVENF